jgi:hypothetical protein
MALLDFFMGIQDPIVGSYLVTKATAVSTSSSVAPCNMVGELSAPGIPPQTIEHYSALTSIAKWPRPGDVLPVLFDRKNPEFMRITWKEVPQRPAQPPAAAPPATPPR